ncbi:AAA family ATPase [Mucilaginibacter sp.]|uniref:AAA family ATPase n=1 Tax=Mucilaginibacter sp. TaxID=1882438 RepID=UPI00283EB6E5|nr:AAA family ATPase [Mucilaginibacter sp.]MDR3591678.1 AAA family ATPase [Negativicutes bacterium]MDR3696471.1 AAA family ATPase [Mucilaginibacter sp.]
MFPERPFQIEILRAEARGIQPPKQPDAPKIKRKKPGNLLRPQPGFIIKPGIKWVKSANRSAEAQMLFGHFWYQGELCILYADTNVGKSILAVQIGLSIASGKPIGTFAMDAQPCPVLYFDFELSEKQFAKRYSDAAGKPYPLHPRFYRGVFNPASTKAASFATYEEFINNEIENALLTTKAKVLIIDNITCLRQGAQAAAGTINLVRGLQAIKNTYGLSILVLAHTPKRNPVKPLSRNCLQGSKMLINFCDSAFAIGESHAPAPEMPGATGLRYLKQIKQRSTTEAYGAGNICLFRLVKPGNFLHARFYGQGIEADHLLHFTEKLRRERQARIADLNRQGLSIRQIAADLNLGTTTIFKALRKIEKQG